MACLKRVIVFVILFSGVSSSARIPRHGGNYDDGSYPGGDYSAIPGNPGVDYPIFGPHPPITNFQCLSQRWVPGYYADPVYNCQVYHLCEAGGKDNVFLCPNGTIFNQQYFVCDWWYNVDCRTSTSFYFLNGNLFVQTGSHGGSGGFTGGSGGFTGGTGGTTGFYK